MNYLNISESDIIFNDNIYDDIIVEYSKIYRQNLIPMLRTIHNVLKIHFNDIKYYLLPHEPQKIPINNNYTKIMCLDIYTNYNIHININTYPTTKLCLNIIDTEFEIYYKCFEPLACNITSEFMYNITDIDNNLKNKLLDKYESNYDLNYIDGLTFNTIINVLVHNNLIKKHISENIYISYYLNLIKYKNLITNDNNYTNLIPIRFAGYTIAFVILLRPIVKDDIGMLEHEKVHVNQFWRSFGLFGIAYKLSKTYRLKYELEAYTKQLEFCADKERSKSLFAYYLSTNYKLDISQEDALKLF